MEALGFTHGINPIVVEFFPAERLGVKTFVDTTFQGISSVTEDEVMTLNDEPFFRKLSATEARIQEAVMPILEAESVELVWIQVVPGQQRARVRLFVDMLPGVDSPESYGQSDKHIEVGLLQTLSRQISNVLDVEENEKPLFSGAYNLEVSSPGLDRPLTKRSHFMRAIGAQVAFQVDPPLDGARKFKARLQSAEPEKLEITYLDGEESVVLPIEQVRTAHIVYEF